MRQTGIYQKLGNLDYFIPHPLPPSNPPLQMTPEIMTLYGQAIYALSKLNEMSKRVPDTNRFIKAYVVKEALLSSAIEGIHTTLIDVLTTLQDDTKPDKDTQLVLNYTHALNIAVHMITQEKFPLTVSVILKAHAALMSGGQGEKFDPGNFRKQSVRVGNLVPPAAPELNQLMSGLEKYINEPSELPPLLRAGLAHVHFETIHPFLDGNGRIGRLLIVLMLIHDDLLQSPILYPSYYFKKHHFEYYQRLDRVRTDGDYEGWIIYYLKAIHESATDAYTRANEIEQLENNLKKTIQTDDYFASIRTDATQILTLLFAHPVVDIALISTKSSNSYDAVQNIFKLFVQAGIVSEMVVPNRSSLYRFEPYLALLEKEY